MNVRIKGIVERIPFVPALYRGARDRLAFYNARSIRTKWGFEFCGNDKLAAGGGDRREIDELARNMRESDCFVDVGANVGFFTCLAASMGKKVIAVEPSALNRSYLRKNIKLNSFSGVKVFGAALSDTTGMSRLYGQGTGSSLLAGWAGSDTCHFERIPLMTLDSVMESAAGKRVLIKIDVEGAEHKVMSGALATLNRDSAPVWLVEICLSEHFPGGTNPLFAETFGIFFSHGYRCVNLGSVSDQVTMEMVSGWVKRESVTAPTPIYIFSKR